ncbi:MAG: ubiquinone biosynthesis protein [Frankiales bacterium]|nr:ubiquinone biosynthesis protein [Frankiales bacterium]
MTTTTRLQRVRRYADLLRLLARHGDRDLLRGLDEMPVVGDLVDEDASQDAERLAADLEKLGPTFIKVGQLLSTRADLLPPPYIEALARLQDKVEACEFPAIREAVETELGARLSHLFTSFEETPLGSASLAQVHRASLHDGRRVAVKVQRPGIRGQVLEDLDVLGRVVDLLTKHTETGSRLGLSDVFAGFRRTLLEELDYTREAGNLVTLRDVLAEHEMIVVPEPIESYCTSRVLTMELLEGRKVSDLGPLAQLELDGDALAEALIHAYLEQLLGAGLVHADPHPGNVLVLDVGGLGLVDVGMVVRLPDSTRKQLVKLLLAISEGRGEDAANVVVAMGEPLEDFDERRFISDVADVVERSYRAVMKDIDSGAVVMEVTRSATVAGLRTPPTLAIVGKTLLELDHVARLLAPTFRPIDAVRSRSAQIVQAGMSFSPGSVLGAVMEAKDFAEQLPARVNRVMDAVARGKFELQVNAFDETEMLKGLHRVANRVVTGLVLSALIIGAAMLMQVNSSWQIFGYPGLAMVVFALAALGGGWLLVSIVASDRRVRRRR